MILKTDLAAEILKTDLDEESLNTNFAKGTFSETQGIRWETFILTSDDLTRGTRKRPDLEDRTTAAGEMLIFDCKISESRDY